MPGTPADNRFEFSRKCALWLLLWSLAWPLAAAELPAGFVDVRNAIPDLRVELRYLGSDNFLGVPVDGYEGERLILTAEAAAALSGVQDELRAMGLGLLVYDGYRPQRAVDHFVRWAKDLDDQVNKAAYYPGVDKAILFAEGYIAERSGHTRGSTVDLTIAGLCQTQMVDMNVHPTVATTDNESGAQAACGVTLDMGTPWDYFGPESWPSYSGITAQQRANRLLLRSLMLAHGFKGLDEEWWHFTLVDEPFPETYFDFPMR